MRSYSSTLVVLVGALASSATASVVDAGPAQAAAPVRSFEGSAFASTKTRLRQPVRTQRPWKARRPATLPASSHQLLDVARWPEEPLSPEPLDAAKFREAVAYLCNKGSDAVPADELIAASQEAGVDPFLLASLMNERSRCNRKKTGRGGIGLLALQRSMYESPQAPGPKIAASEWRTANLLSARGNLSLGARLLRMWQDQHETLDLAFGGVNHRSPVSHFFWGDVVGSSGNEDLVLTTRRRLIARYQGNPVAPAESLLGVAVVPPLESVPRVATSGPGDDRDGGARRHRGLDVVASVGEPVRAIADGTVIFAGANLGGGNARKAGISPRRIGRYANRRLGVGGIYLCLRHTGTAKTTSGVVSCYMHLQRYFVAQGSAVKAGDVIAIVGRTGVKRSPPHLHFEVRVDGVAKDPWRYFSDTIIPPRDTLTYQYNTRTRRARLKAARIAQMVRVPKS
ncbi:MAG TPA: M23 family metallopeptidase [Polyangia bacterium]